jgi:ABC-type lipoprotein release transport system permease subunit
MNPLSTWTYYRRHKRHAILLLSLSIVVTIGLYSMVALVWGVFVEPPRLAYMALSEFSVVTPQSDESGPDPAVLAQLQANPDVANVIPATAIRIQLPGMLGASFQFDLLGLSKEHVPYILDRFGAILKDGHLPEPGTNELLLSQDVAAMLGVKVGEPYAAVSSEFYGNMDTRPEPTTFEVVGVLKSDIELGIVSLEFLNDQEQYRQFPARFLVVAQEGREAAVDDFLRSEIETNRTEVMTLTKLNERIMNEALPGLVLLIPPILIVAIAFSFVIVVVNQLANARRLPEFGILHATGRSRSWLVRRLTLETTAPALAGWALGIGIAWLVLYLLRVTFFASRGYDLNYIVWLPMMFALPVPAAIAGFTFLSVRRTLKRLDPVAIVERRELSQEGDQKQERTASKSSRANSSSPRPLAPVTFYRRHRRRAVLLISGMSAMILAVVFFIFALAVGADAQKSFLGYLSRVSIVRSPGIVQGLDPSVVARIEAHPTVERVIPIAPRSHMLSVYIPPFTSVEASPFGVYAEDMAYLVELYGLELEQGHLPRRGSNEMVIPQALAQNRDIHIGDVIGAPDQPAYPGAPSLPVEFVVSGIFARPQRPEDGSGWGFVSLEFLEANAPFPIPDVPPLIVVPKAGQKSALDDWLEHELAGLDASVLTHDQELSRVQNKARQDMIGMALLESVIATVAAIGLAVLNYIFTSQRHSEFGVLHALGYGRRQLVRRVLGETAFTTGIAWGLSAIVGMTGLLYLRFAVFAPQGLTFNLFNLSPWLYTLPIPVAVLAVTGGTIARTLSKLDPVSIIERR